MQFLEGTDRREQPGSLASGVRRSAQGCPAGDTTSLPSASVAGVLGVSTPASSSDRDPFDSVDRNSAVVETASSVPTRRQSSARSLPSLSWVIVTAYTAPHRPHVNVPEVGRSASPDRWAPHSHSNWNPMRAMTGEGQFNYPDDVAPLQTLQMVHEPAGRTSGTLTDDPCSEVPAGPISHATPSRGSRRRPPKTTRPPRHQIRRAMLERTSIEFARHRRHPPRSIGPVRFDRRECAESDAPIHPRRPFINTRLFTAYVTHSYTAVRSR